jgi:hypothetical protein
MQLPEDIQQRVDTLTPKEFCDVMKTVWDSYGNIEYDMFHDANVLARRLGLAEVSQMPDTDYDGEPGTVFRFPAGGLIGITQSGGACWPIDHRS